jgi:putative phosphoribosyl transferase
MNRRFRDRADAGRQLAEKLDAFAGRTDVIVLALPRGGVPIGYQVAKALNAPLDIFLVQKLGVPGHEEFAKGAIASGGVRVLNGQLVRQLPNAEALIEVVTQRETAELQRREREYRNGRPLLDVRGKTVILVDDGLATGSTMRAAVRALRKRDVAEIIVAVPVGAPEACAEFQDEVDEVVCLMMPRNFRAVGRFYQDFSQTTDNEVRELLARAAAVQTRS